MSGFDHRDVRPRCPSCGRDYREGADGHLLEARRPPGEAPGVHEVRRRLLAPFLAAVDPEGELGPAARRRRAVAAMRAYYARLEQSD